MKKDKKTDKIEKIVEYGKNYNKNLRKILDDDYAVLVMPDDPNFTYALPVVYSPQKHYMKAPTAVNLFEEGIVINIAPDRILECYSSIKNIKYINHEKPLTLNYTANGDSGYGVEFNLGKNGIEAISKGYYKQISREHVPDPNDMAPCK